MMKQKLRMGMVGGGQGAFIGAVHRMAAALDGEIELVCGAFSSDPERSKASGAELGLAPQRAWHHASMPWALLRAGSWLVPMWRELAEMEYLWRVPHRLDDHGLQAVAGPLHATPFATALRAALSDLGFGAAAAHTHVRLA